MAVLVTSGRTKLAEIISQHDLHLAWGNGDTDWDANPIAEPLSATGLVAELGRVSASVVDFAVPDELGSIDVPTGTFSLSASPTNYLYFKFDFGFDDASDQDIREAGLFMDTVLVGGLPQGQTYFEPADVADPGTLVALEYFTKIVRSPLVRQQFEFVLVI